MESAGRAEAFPYTGCEECIAGDPVGRLPPLHFILSSLHILHFLLHRVFCGKYLFPVPFILQDHENDQRKR